MTKLKTNSFIWKNAALDFFTCPPSTRRRRSPQLGEIKCKGLFIPSNPRCLHFPWAFLNIQFQLSIPLSVATSLLKILAPSCSFFFFLKRILQRGSSPLTPVGSKRRSRIKTQASLGASALEHEGRERYFQKGDNQHAESRIEKDRGTAPDTSKSHSLGHHLLPRHAASWGSSARAEFS